ncbi:hypothetical protein [Pseudomonas asiatica]|uniref:hypothetical protein n=1 Tax=Pseudomonas asiatica TaxID=2219225 RepID=UPI0018D5E27E|nr:hypothetical protein [Pseudomonas asiatica]MBH3378362.1 hypothetical protein [Pseudomonas asiatica]
MALWEPINGVYTATAPLFPWIGSLPSFDASIWGAVVSAGFGAGVGAWGAGRIARNAKLREELLAEFRSIDVAISLCVTVSDVAGGMKLQYVSDLLHTYESNRKRFEAHKASGKPRASFTARIDQMKLPTFDPPVRELQELVLKNLSISPNGVKSMLALIQAVGNLNWTTEGHNSLVEMFQHGGLPKGFTADDYYFEIPVGGMVNTQYGTSVRGIAKYTDDVLFFADKLVDCLTERGLKVRDRYEKLTGEKYLVRKASTAKGKESLIPTDEAYAPWMSGWEDDFSAPVAKPKWWQRKGK